MKRKGVEGFLSQERWHWPARLYMLEPSFCESVTQNPSYLLCVCHKDDDSRLLVSWEREMKLQWSYPVTRGVTPSAYNTTS